jgi:hypothetical protein
MRSQPGRLARGVALGLFAVFVVVSLPAAATHSFRRIVHAVVSGLRGESSEAAVRRIQGDAYVDAVAAIARAVPREGAYFLLDAGPYRMGAAYWARFDLAPRKALFLGRLDDPQDRAALAGRLAAAPGLPVVVARGDREPPILLDQESFRREVGR